MRPVSRPAPPFFTLSNLMSPASVSIFYSRMRLAISPWALHACENSCMYVPPAVVPPQNPLEVFEWCTPYCNLICCAMNPTCRLAWLGLWAIISDSEVPPHLTRVTKKKMSVWLSLHNAIPSYTQLRYCEHHRWRAAGQTPSHCAIHATNHQHMVCMWAGTGYGRFLHSLANALGVPSNECLVGEGG